MSDVTIKYKGQSIATMDASGTKTLGTQGKYCEGDIGVEYVKPAGPSGTKSITISQNGTTTEDVAAYANAEIIVNVQGGGDENPVLKDVVFVDYDGTVVQNYSASEFLALSALPENPSHSGLVAQGWNWSLADAKTYVQNHGALVVGQNYTTTDGKTHIYLEITEETLGFYSYVGFIASVRNGVTIDWGDGSPVETNQNTGNVINGMKHTYAAIGKYEITLECTSGDYELGFNGSNYGFVYDNSAASRKSSMNITAVEIGNNCTRMCRQAFNYATNLSTISIPTTTKLFGNGTTGDVFSSALRLKCVVFPDGFTLSGKTHLPANGILKFVSFPKDAIKFESVTGLRFLRMLTLPEMSEQPGTVANEYYNLERFVAPGTFTAIAGGFCRNCRLVKSVTIPASVSSIADYALTDSPLQELHLLPVTPPTLANTRGLPAMSCCTIFVPYSADHSVLAAYQSATNWSTVASNMQEEPQ